jgi:hypothetical protein
MFKFRLRFCLVIEYDDPCGIGRPFEYWPVPGALRVFATDIGAACDAFDLPLRFLRLLRGLLWFPRDRVASPVSDSLASGVQQKEPPRTERPDG